MAAADTARLIASLELDNRKFQSGAAASMRTLGTLDRKFGTIGQNLGRSLNKGASAAARNIEHFAVVGGAALIGLGAASVHAAGDFEAGLNTINTVAQVTPEKLAAIGEGIRKLSRDTGTSVSDLQAAYYDLVSAGIKAADAQNVLAQANTLAIGGLSTTAEAVDLLTTAINSYGGNAKNAARFTNYFAEAIAAGKTTAAQLAASFAQVGPLAAKSGIGLDQLAAALGVMTATGTQTSEAMTQIRSAIVALEKPNAKLAALEHQTGIDFGKVARQKGLVTAYEQLRIAANKAGVPMAKLTGRIEGTLFAVQLTGPELKKYNAELDKVRHSSDGAGVAQQQAAERMKGFNFAMQRLGTNLNDAAITIGSALLPQLADLAGELTTFLQGHTDEIKKFGNDLAGGIKDAVGWLKSLNWDAIASSFRAAAGFAKDLVSAFLGMPTWVQTAVITGWGLNKLTGGALGDIVGELGKGLIKGVLGMNAGVVNINAGVVNGGGLGGGLGTAAEGAVGAGAAGGAIASVAVVGMSAAVFAGFGLALYSAMTQHDTSALAKDAQGNVKPGQVFSLQHGFGRTPQQLAAAAGHLDAAAGSIGNAGKFFAPKGSSRPFGEHARVVIDSGSIQALSAKFGTLLDKLHQANRDGNTKLGDKLRAHGKALEAKLQAAERATRSGLATVTSKEAQSISAEDRIHAAAEAGAAATNAGTSRIVGAIASNRPVVNTSVVVTVTASGVQKSSTTSSSYGEQNGSAGGGGTHAGPGGASTPG